MRTRTAAAFLLLAAALLPALPACTNSASAGKGDSTAVFNKATGNLTANTDRSLEDSFAASKTAMNDMGYSTEKANQDALKGVIVAREADGGRIDVTLQRKADRVTEIEVGVGAFGNESKARLILDKILARLGR
jgi:hypothetical protein